MKERDLILKEMDQVDRTFLGFFLVMYPYKYCL